MVRELFTMMEIMLECCLVSKDKLALEKQWKFGFVGKYYMNYCSPSK